MKVLHPIFSLLLLMNFSMPYSNNRMLYIFGKETNQELVTQQTNLLKSTAAAVKERDIELKVIAENDVICKQFKISPGVFTVVLVGKDGGEKYRTGKLLQPADLFAIIDAMPMRKQEMKQQNKER